MLNCLGVLLSEDCLQSSPAATLLMVPCHCSQSLAWFLPKLAHGDQYDGVERTEAYRWIKKPWHGLLVSLWVSYGLGEL